ncbi:integrin alpha-2 [Callorhinchus milii]|uniref:Integrin subunit alpha 2 n=1 Tax=Callorhinchus milii TaxID=7868 RepID=A0A4W3KJZ7_CALMI|nr:integrin alpha-2 [Callorhinchus milii]|eukprot:gi/632949859/ref/XP_007890393.1/ PREDICTED: integrin alpha-2 [Callorhinchus milii]
MGRNRRIVCFLLLIHGTLLLQPSQAFNVDVKGAQVYTGPADGQFGYSIQQFSNSKGQWLLVGSPWSGAPQNRIGDVYKCPVTGTQQTCDKLNLGDVMTVPNVTEVKQNMNVGLTLLRNEKSGGFLTCGPLWAQKCGSHYYPVGMCSEIDSSFKLSRTFLPALQSCGSFIDIVIVLDGSNSIWPWDPVQNFLTELVSSLDIGPGKAQVGVVQYAETARFEFKLSDHKTKAEAVKASARVSQMLGSETNTAHGIRFARNQAFSLDNGRRKGATKVLVVVTDGESHDSGILPSEIAACETERIIRFGIAVLGYYNRVGIDTSNLIKEIKSIASEPKEKHFFNVSSEGALLEIASALGERIFSIEGTSNKNEDTFLLEMAEVGFSAHYTPKQSLLILGAVGAYDWSGTIVHQSSDETTIFTKKIFASVLQDRNDSSYLGYALTSLVSADSVFYVAGAPRFQHTGQIIVYTVGSNGEVTIKQKQKGEQLGSYFGSVLCSVDVNRDSLTDILLVGSPTFMGEQKNEEGRVYMFSVNEGILTKQGDLEGPTRSGNTRFGASIAVISDINLDGYNDIAVGAPLENDNRGAVYIYSGHKTTIQPKSTQKILASEVDTNLKYFGLSIDGQMDMDSDGITDLSVGSIGRVVQLWSRSIVNVSVTMAFTPEKLSIFDKNCMVNGKSQICARFNVCFKATFKPDTRVSSVNIRYKATLDGDLLSLHVISRGLFEENHDRLIQKDITLDSVSKCDEHKFYVQDTRDIVNPIGLRLDLALQNVDIGPVLDANTPRSRESFIPFSKECGEDEECITDLVIKAHPAIALSSDSSYIVHSKNKQLTIDVKVSNKKENAYNTKVFVQFSSNLYFASSVLFGATEVLCRSMEKTSVTCDVGHPVLRQGAEVSFQINLDFNLKEPKKEVVLDFSVESESAEQQATMNDNRAQVTANVQYDSEILFLRDTNLNFYEIDSGKQAVTTITTFDDIGPEYMITLKVNTGHFPINVATVTVEIPVTTKGNNHLLYLTDVKTNQGSNLFCEVKLDSLKIKQQPYTATFSEENLRNVKDLNCETAQCEKFMCSFNNLEQNKQYSINITSRIWSGTFLTASLQSLTLTANAEIQTNQPSLLIIRNSTLTIPITITNPVGKKDIPTGVIVGSTIGGLLLLAVLIAVLWKLGFFKRKYNKLIKDEEENDSLTNSPEES